MVLPKAENASPLLRPFTGLLPTEGLETFHDSRKPFLQEIDDTAPLCLPKASLQGFQFGNGDRIQAGQSVSTENFRAQAYGCKADQTLALPQPIPHLIRDVQNIFDEAPCTGDSQTEMGEIIAISLIEIYKRVSLGVEERNGLKNANVRLPQSLGLRGILKIARIQAAQCMEHLDVGCLSRNPG
jgi:hypothetical protein